MRNVLVYNYEVVNLFKGENSLKNKTQEVKKKIKNEPKEKKNEKFSSLLDSQMKTFA